MPQGPVLLADYGGYDNLAYHGSPALSARRPHHLQQSPDSSSDVIYSVKEQEAQFELLTRELEAERQSVATQLERCKFDSETVSVCSVSSTNDPLDWHIQDTSQASREASGSHLYDSCLKVLQERGVNMGDSYQYGHDPLNDSINSGRLPANESYRQVETYKTQTVNGPYGAHVYGHGHGSQGSESPRSSRLSVNSNMSNDMRAKKSVTTTVTTKVTTHRSVFHNGPYGDSPSGSPGPRAHAAQYGGTSLHVEHRLDQSYEGSQDGYPSYHQIDGNYYSQPMSSIRDQLPGDTSYDSRGVEAHYAPDRVARYADDPYLSPATHGHDNVADRSLTPRAAGDLASTTTTSAAMYPSYKNYSILPQDLDRSRESDGYPAAYLGHDPRNNESFASGGVPNGEYRPLREQYSQDESFRRSQSPSPQGSAVRLYDSAYGRPDDPPFKRPWDDIGRETVHNLSAGPAENFPANNGDDARWRSPDLHEVIEFLSHPSNSIKANAAAYLQHLTFGDNDIKQKTRSLNGIPALVDLLNNDNFEVHKNALGALRNLSFGRDNDENKRAIKNADGIPALVRHLRKTPDNDIRELVTAILWNLSSCKDLKKPIIDDALTVLVNSIIVPHSGWDDHTDLSNPRDVHWSTVFRNASGVLRNVSSDGEYGRKKLRECEGLVDAVMYIVRAAIGKNDIDNKSVENCVCVLRNLCYGCQEVHDPDYWKKKASPKANGKANTAGGKPGGGVTDAMGCFGKGNKKKPPVKNEEKINNFQKLYPNCDPNRGMGLLWNPDVVHVYMPLLSDCSNPETLEASAGAIQNLAACDWQPSIEIRAAVRKEKGLPVIVELLNIEEDRVVCAAATALRNLALDQRNKELIGKYAMHKLIQKLPSKSRRSEHPPSDATVAAVLATLYEVVKNNPDFCQTLLNHEGVDRLVDITSSRGEYSSKVVKFAASILFAMWQFKDLHEEYKRRGYKENHFVTRTMAARAAAGRPPESGNNTLVRPRQDLGRPVTEFNASTLPPINRQKYQPDSNNMPPDLDYGHQNPQYGDSFPPAQSVFDQKTRHETYGNYKDLRGNHAVANDVAARAPNNVIGGDLRVNYADYPVESTRRDDYSTSEHNDSRAGHYNVSGVVVGGGSVRYQDDVGRHDTSVRYQDDIQPYGTAVNPYGRDRVMNESRDSDRFVEPYSRDDRLLLHGAATEDIALHEMTNPSYSTSGDYHHGVGYRPVGGVSVLPAQSGHEPLYARVNKAQKSHRLNAQMALDTSGPGGGGDSWV